MANATLPPFAQRLRHIREAAGLTIEQAAAETETSPADWQQWENAEGQPWVEEALRIKGRFGVTLDWLTGD
jgi:transcriptional regulator with XRE-family HTH domain